MPLLAIRKLMFIFGVDVLENRSKRTKLRVIYQKLCSFVWMFFLLHSLASFLINDVPYFGAFDKAILKKKFNQIYSVVLWYILNRRADQIVLMIRDIFSLAVTLRVRKPVWFIRMSTFAVAAGSLVYWFASVILFSENRCINAIQYITFGSKGLPFGKNCKLFYLIRFLRSRLQMDLEMSVSTIYMILCIVARRLLNFHSEKAKALNSKSCSCMREPNLKGHFEEYHRIVKALKSIESTMSFPIFLVLLNNLVDMFSLILQMDPFNSGRSFLRVFKIGVYVKSFFSLICFLGVSLSAAGVTAEDKKSQEENVDILRHFESNGVKNGRENFHLLWYMTCSKPFTLSAGGFFNFTRGFVLSTIGSVLTYSLLILNI